MAVRELYAFTKQVKGGKSFYIKLTQIQFSHNACPQYFVSSFDNNLYQLQEVSLRVFRARLLKLVELASFHIFTRRNDSDWDPPSNAYYNMKYSNNSHNYDIMSNSSAAQSSTNIYVKQASKSKTVLDDSDMDDTDEGKGSSELVKQ